MNDTVLDKKNEIRLRKELLGEILGNNLKKPIFDQALVFYEKIFHQDPDLIVCMSRKSWCAIQLFLPFLEENNEIVVDRNKITHDRMVHPWFAELDQDKHSQIKVFVIDDTFQAGRALDKCLRRLKCAYNVTEKNLYVWVLAMPEDNKRLDEKKEFYKVYHSCDPDISSFEVRWGGGNFYSKDEISAISYNFVEALHACSVPYVGYIPAFRLPVKAVQTFLGADRGKEVESSGKPSIRVPGYLEQKDLREPLSESAIIGYYNITSHLMRQHDVEAFYFSFPKDVEEFNKLLPTLDSGKHDLPFFPPEHALSIAALRFYINRTTGIALVVPYLSLKDCYAEKDIVKFFPEELKPLMREMTEETVWGEYEGRLAAYRLLRFASAYLWGKYVFKQWFERDVEKEDIVSKGGICSKKFFDWLDGPSAEQDLLKIWAFFAPENGNVVEKTPEPVSLDDITHRDLRESDEKNYKEAIMRSLSVSVDPVDYFTSISMIFRYIFEQDRELQNNNPKNANEKDFSLVEQFHGFPIYAFFALLLLQYPKLKARRDVLVTVTLMLCDMGIAVTQLCQRKRQRGGDIIGTVLFNGEQSCHALAPVASEYSHFLSELPDMMKKFNQKQRQKKFKMVRNKVKKYFEKEIKQGIVRRMPLEELMAPLDYVGNIVVEDPERGVAPYSVLPRSSFFDDSGLFFIKLREKLKNSFFCF